MTAPQIDQLDRIDRFVSLGKDLAALPVMRDDDRYVPAASDLHAISWRLSVANENMVRWLNDFLYFDFSRNTARSDYLELAKRYDTAKRGNEFKALKFRCSEIDDIYREHIKGSLKTILGRPAADEENIFADLGTADGQMVDFINQEFTAAIDSFLRDVDQLDADDFDGAEAARLRMKVSCAELSARLEQFSTGLSDLVISFARLAGEPVTLHHDTA